MLWEEYTLRYPNRCYSYSQLCERYKSKCQLQKRSMRQIHMVGENIFIDCCGHTVPIVSPATGESRQVQIFISVFGAFNYTFAQATWSKSLPDWQQSHVRAFEFLGGTPAQLNPDNLKSNVSKACRYELDLNPSYQQLAEHYQCGCDASSSLQAQGQGQGQGQSKG